MDIAITAWDYLDVETSIQSLLVWNLQQFCESFFQKQFFSLEDRLQSQDCRTIICKPSFVESLKSIYLNAFDKICCYLMSNMFNKEDVEDDDESSLSSSDNCCSDSDDNDKGKKRCN